MEVVVRLDDDSSSFYLLLRNQFNETNTNIELHCIALFSGSSSSFFLSFSFSFSLKVESVDATWRIGERASCHAVTKFCAGISRLLNQVGLINGHYKILTIFMREKVFFFLINMREKVDVP